jgi:hypothetical protein
LKAQDGRREELNRVERQRAYGLDVDPERIPAPSASRLKAGKKRPFIVAMRDGCPVALDTISGRPAILERIFVKEKEGMTLKVDSVDFFGRDGADGRPVTETIIPKSIGAGADGAADQAAFFAGFAADDASMPSCQVRKRNSVERSSICFETGVMKPRE